jgi:ribosomal protein S27AE
MSETVPIDAKFAKSPGGLGDLKRGEWQQTPGVAAVIRCPRCAVASFLAGDKYKVDGELVRPAFVCKCGFAAFVTLVGYSGG